MTARRRRSLAAEQARRRGHPTRVSSGLVVEPVAEERGLRQEPLRPRGGVEGGERVEEAPGFELVRPQRDRQHGDPEHGLGLVQADLDACSVTIEGDQIISARFARQTSAPVARDQAWAEPARPAGAWSLFLLDDTAGGSGSVAGGWSLTFDHTVESG